MAYSIPLPHPSTRPSAPRIEGVTERHRRHGRRLAQFHAMHLGELARVRRLLDHVVETRSGMADLAENMAGMQMVSNFRLFGNLCGGTCEMLTGHHSIEDQWVFPALQGHNDGLNRVVSRLAEEHLVIHQMLVDMETAAIALLQKPDLPEFETLRQIFTTLEGFVISHFGYEQEELEEALGFYEVDI